MLFPLRECGTAGAVDLPSFHIHAFSTAGVWDCGSSSSTPFRICVFTTAGLREQLFYPHFIFMLFPLRECGTAVAVLLPSFHIRAFSTFTSFDFRTAGASVQCHAIVAGYSEVAPIPLPAFIDV